MAQTSEDRPITIRLHVRAGRESCSAASRAMARTGSASKAMGRVMSAPGRPARSTSQETETGDGEGVSHLHPEPEAAEMAVAKS